MKRKRLRNESTLNVPTLPNAPGGMNPYSSNVFPTCIPGTTVCLYPYPQGTPTPNPGTRPSKSMRTGVRQPKSNKIRSYK